MTKEQLLAMVSEHYDKLQALNKINNFYDYEKEFEDIWKELGQSVFEKNLSKFSADTTKAIRTEWIINDTSKLVVE